MVHTGPLHRKSDRLPSPTRSTADTSPRRATTTYAPSWSTNVSSPSRARPRSRVLVDLKSEVTRRAHRPDLPDTASSLQLNARASPVKDHITSVAHWLTDSCPL